jgi:hypothetical protein
MSPENVKKLKTQYPKLFSNITIFECNDGWYDLIDCISKLIVAHDSNVKAFQVKEKFGGLRFYIDSADKYLNGVTNLGELLSFHICEETGNKGHPYKFDGWIQTLSPEEAKKRYEKGKE